MGSWFSASSDRTCSSGSSSDSCVKASPSHRDCSASLFSTFAWEPSFHLGLCRPSLLLVLRRGIAYPWDLPRRSRRSGNSWMLTPAATRSAACELSSRMPLRRTAFSSTLPNERTSSLRASLPASRLVRGRIPPRPSTSATRWRRSCARGRASRASASCLRRGAARGEHEWGPCCAA